MSAFSRIPNIRSQSWFKPALYIGLIALLAFAGHNIAEALAFVLIFGVLPAGVGIVIFRFRGWNWTFAFWGLAFIGVVFIMFFDTPLNCGLVLLLSGALGVIGYCLACLKGQKDHAFTWAIICVIVPILGGLGWFVGNEIIRIVVFMAWGLQLLMYAVLLAVLLWIFIPAFKQNLKHAMRSKSKTT